MNSYSHAESFNHKRSNFSSFASQKINERTHSEQENYSPQPLQFFDTIVLLHSERFVLGLADTVQLAPGVINLNQTNSFMLGMLKLLPISPQNQANVVQIGQKFYLRSCECNLYLSAQDGLLKKFTSVILKRQCSPQCVFTFQRPAQKSDNAAYNRQLLRIRSVASGLYLHIQQENLDLSRYKHIWLSQLSDQFRVTVLNRHRTHGDYLNNNDIILLSVQMKCQKKYLGVIKSLNLYQVLEKKQAISIDVNHHYYSLGNCQIQYFFQQNGRKRSLIPCLWRIIRNNFSHDLTFLIKNKEEVSIQHLQTGLFLSIDGNNNPTLQSKETPIKIQNMHHYKTQFSITTKFQPIYIKHSVSITSPLLDKNYFIQRVPSRNCIILYFTQFLSFLDNLIKTMMNPKAINQNREQLIKQIKLYVFIYQELQAHLEDFIDQGFYFFQYTLRILQLLKILLRDQRANNFDLQFSLRKTLLAPLTFEILKFISLVVMTNETYIKITSEDHKKTKEIIHIIFVLYHFHSKPTVNLMVALASTNPDLVVRLLSEKIYKADHFQDRVELIEAINQIIDQFRRINFDQENLKGILQRQHKLIIGQNCIYISFQRKQHSIFDLFQSLSKFDNSQALNSTDRETFYFFYYLLSIVKILLSSKTQQLIQSQFVIKDKSISHRNLIEKLSEEFLKNPNITGRVLILELIYQLSAEAYHKEFITYNKLNFIVYGGNTLTCDTPLASILKVSPDNILDWIFSKEHIMDIISQVLSEEWQRKFQLITKLKFFSNLINFLTAVVITCTYDVQTLNRIQEFGITVATIYYRKRVNARVLIETRTKINEYALKLSYLIVDGVKIYLDNLMIRLGSFFDAVLAVKKRLFLYPMYNDREALFCFPLFRNHYTQLSMNQRIRNEAKAVQQLLKLNQEQLEVSGLILNSSMNHAEGIRMIEKIIQDLDCLAIIMQSFRLYGQDKYLKQNIVASMKLKILNIEGLLKSVSKNKLYNRCGDAFNLSSHLFQFILENSSEQELILPLLQNLQDRVMYNHNIFTLIHQNALDFFKVLLDSSSLKSAKMILKWVGKQIQNMTAPIDVKLYEFLYCEVVRLIDQQFSLNLLFLINMLKEIGLHHPVKEEILYSKLIRLPQTQDFLTQCASIKNFKLPIDRLERDHQYLYNQYQTSLQLLTIFRVCSTYPHLMSHLNNLLPYQQIRDGMQNHQQYFLYRSLLSYIILELKGQVHIDLVNLYIIFISEQLCQYTRYAAELDKYRARDSLFKEREGKAHTHFCRAYSLAPNNPKNMIEDQLIQQKHYYWQFLLWIPFYHQPEGLLKNLETIVLLIIEKEYYNESIEYNLEKIHKYLIQIKALVSTNEEHKEFVKFISNIFNLIALIQRREKFFKKGRTQVVKTDQLTEQIFKLLMDNDLIKPFLCKVIVPVVKTSQFPKESTSSIYSATRPITITISPNIIQQPSLLDYSENVTLRDKTHHSVIAPYDKFDQSRFVNEEQKFDLIAFFSALKATTGHRIRLMGRLTYIFLHYFERGGSLAMLNFKLLEEINNHRNRVTEYREEEAEYQLQRRVLRSQRKDSFTEGIICSQISFSIEKIEMWKLQELVEVNQLKIMGIILKQIAAKEDLENNTAILPKPSELQGLLLTLLRLFDHSRYNLGQLLECLSNLVQVIIKQRGEQSLPEKSYIRDLQSSFSLFLYEVTNTHDVRTNGQLYFKIAVLFAKVEFKLTRRFNHKLQEFLLKTALSQLPKQLFRHCMLHFIEFNMEMLMRSTRVFSIQDFSHVLKFIGRDFSNLIPENYLSQNMDFYENNRIITSVLNLLQLFLTQLSFPKHYHFPQEILSSLARFEHMIYFKIFSRLHQISNAPRILIFQSLVVQLLSFFSTVNLRKFGQFQTSSLLVQRGNCLKDLQLNSKEVYDYYQEHFNFCVMRGENGIMMVQAYPRECSYMSWKAEFHKILSSYSDPGEKKDIVFSYSILAVQQQKSQLKHQNFFHRLQLTAIILSTINLSIGLIQRLTSANPHQLGIFFQLLMLANLLLLTFVILQRLMMIRKIIKLQIKIGRSSSWYTFLFRNKKSFLFFAIFLLFVNINSLFRPNYTSLLFFIHVFSKNNINNTSSLSITTNFHIIFAIGLLAYALQLIFGLLIGSQEGGFTLPLFNIATRYNIEFFSAFFTVWDDSYLQTGKIYYFLGAIKALGYLFVSSVIYFYISHTAEQNKESKFCLLCESRPSSIDTKYYNHQANHHTKYQHNLFKFIAVFKYVLSKDLLSLQEQQIRKMVLQKYRSIFN